MSIAEVTSKFELWKNRPDIFVREVFNVEPDKWQDDVLRAFPHQQRIAMKACRGPGKTCVLSWLALNFLLTRFQPKIAATSITGANLSDGFWAECARWMQTHPIFRDNFTWTKTRIFLNESPETWFMSARPWSKTADKQEQGNTLAGFRAPSVMFILDESGDIPETIMLAAEAALASCEEGHIIQAGNPSSLDGMLYKSCVRDKDFWYIIEISSAPNDPKRTPRVSKEWAQQQIDQFGSDNPWVVVNIYGQFPASSFNSLIGLEELEESTRRCWREPDYKNHAKILGIDVARSGADSSVIFPRQGLQAFNPIVLRNIDGTEGANRVARKWQEWEADGVMIDNTGGFGSSWVDNLIRLGFSPIGVHFNEKAANPRYYNKRSEMMVELVNWIKRGGCIPDIPELKSALVESTYSFKGDALILEPKELLKTKLGYSPDHMDALMLTFAQPVMKASAVPTAGSFRSNYNPLGRDYIARYLNERR